jgi:hypothetical protein
VDISTGVEACVWEEQADENVEKGVGDFRRGIGKGDMNNLKMMEVLKVYD